MAPKEAAPKAKEAAQKALALDESDVGLTLLLRLRPNGTSGLGWVRNESSNEPLN